jgi:hypothetical protein
MCDCIGCQVKDGRIVITGFGGFDNPTASIPIKDVLNIPKPQPILHRTEAKSPEQCKEFRAIIEKMYATHLDKNADYSPMNILGTGMIGLVTRIWDKVARLVSLHGFDIRDGSLSQVRTPKNESVDDTLLDLANYAIIAMIFRRGKWGK